MVGDTALWEIVGADALTAVTSADLGAPFAGDLFLLFVFSDIQQTSTQNTEGFGTVLML